MKDNIYEVRFVEIIDKTLYSRNENYIVKLENLIEEVSKYNLPLLEELYSYLYYIHVESGDKN